MPHRRSQQLSRLHPPGTPCHFLLLSTSLSPLLCQVLFWRWGSCQMPMYSPRITLSSSSENYIFIILDWTAKEAREFATSAIFLPHSIHVLFYQLSLNKGEKAREWRQRWHKNGKESSGEGWLSCCWSGPLRPALRPEGTAQEATATPVGFPSKGGFYLVLWKLLLGVR